MWYTVCSTINTSQAVASLFYLCFSYPVWSTLRRSSRVQRPTRKRVCPPTQQQLHALHVSWRESLSLWWARLHNTRRSNWGNIVQAVLCLQELQILLSSVPGMHIIKFLASLQLMGYAVLFVMCNDKTQSCSWWKSILLGMQRQTWSVTTPFHV